MLLLELLADKPTVMGKLTERGGKKWGGGGNWIFLTNISN
jgi:hypothetical protein